jgi:hypothetical protein
MIELTDMDDFENIVLEEEEYADETESDIQESEEFKK